MTRRDLSQLLTHAMIDSNVSTKALASLLGISSETVRRWLMGNYLTQTAHYLSALEHCGLVVTVRRKTPALAHHDAADDDLGPGP